MPSRTRPQESHTPQVDLKFSIPAGKDNSAEYVPGGRAGVVARVHRPAAGVAQCRGVAGVVPDVPVLVPVAIGLGAGAMPGVDLDVAVGAEGIGGELEDVPGGVAQRPVGEADLRTGGVV